VTADVFVDGEAAEGSEVFRCCCGRLFFLQGELRVRVEVFVEVFVGSERGTVGLDDFNESLRCHDEGFDVYIQCGLRFPESTTALSNTAFKAGHPTADDFRCYR